jgi:dihydrofolate reductase
MRKLIVSNLVSLDGYFEGPNRELDWFVVEEEFLEYAKDLLRSVDTILFGRITYEGMASYWPTPAAADNDPTITHKMNNLSKVVFSKTLSTVDPIIIGWNNSRLIKGNIAEEIRKMKEEGGLPAGQAGKDMVIFGSGSIVSALTRLGLIDEYRIIVNPVILGKGNPLFNGIKDKFNLELIKTKTLKSGVVIFYYQPEKKLVAIKN